MANCWGFFGSKVHGTKGSAHLGEGVAKPRLFKDYTQKEVAWEFGGQYGSGYQIEHDLLFDAIRNDKPYNETERSAYAAMTGILGRMAGESGKEITWEQAMASNVELAPGLDNFTMESSPPVMPDQEGRYPVAMPGFTKVI